MNTNIWQEKTKFIYCQNTIHFLAWKFKYNSYKNNENRFLALAVWLGASQLSQPRIWHWLCDMAWGFTASPAREKRNNEFILRSRLSPNPPFLFLVLLEVVSMASRAPSKGLKPWDSRAFLGAEASESCSEYSEPEDRKCDETWNNEKWIQ